MSAVDPKDDGAAARAEASRASPSPRDTKDGTMATDDERSRQHCSFILLAEFDIDRGSTLAHVYPNEDAVRGHDHHTLAELMLPDGVHARAEDSTVFLLPSNDEVGEDGRPLTHVLNLVRTKHDSSVRRGALVKAMAIGTRHPCLGVFKPMLMTALDEYFAHPGLTILQKLYDAINGIDLQHVPCFTPTQKMLLRSSERRDLFLERYRQAAISAGQTDLALDSTRTHHVRSTSSSTSASSRSPNDAASQQGGESLKERGGKGRQGEGLDTHWWEVSADLFSQRIVLSWPLDGWQDEVGEYSLSALFNTFSSQPVIGPLHPHLHSNGASTHPLTVLFNAIFTFKRVIFLGHGLPAETVAGHVLAAAALGSACGAIIPGIKERISPYANLISLDTLEETPGFIAGVTNPRFEDLKCWDLLCNVESGRITVAKTIEPAPPVELNLNQAASAGAGNFSGSGGIGSMNGSMGLSNQGGSPHGHAPDAHNGGHTTSASVSSSKNFAEGASSIRSKSSMSGSAFRANRNAGTSVPMANGSHTAGLNEFGVIRGGVPEARADSIDSLFMEDLASAVAARWPETYVRIRVTEYVMGMCRHVHRHEDQFGLTSTATTGLARMRHQPYLNGQLGSGNAFGDRDSELRELIANASRVEGFRDTPAYQRWIEMDAAKRAAAPIQEIDAWHQICRLRGRGKAMQVSEAAAIFSSLLSNVDTDEKVEQLLTYLPLHSGGLVPVANGLFHPQQHVRRPAAALLTRIASHREAGLRFVQSLPLYHRLALARAQRSIGPTTSARGDFASPMAEHDYPDVAAEAANEGSNLQQRQTPSGDSLKHTTASQSGGRISPAPTLAPSSSSHGATSTASEAAILPHRPVGGIPIDGLPGSQDVTGGANGAHAAASRALSKNDRLSAAFKELNLEMDTGNEGGGERRSSLADVSL